jgi:hypothetical protein
MSILSRLEAKKTQVVILREWLESRPKKEREEWLEALRRADLYPSSAILALLEEEGLRGINENTIVRVRRKLEGYVSAR